ncbi:MAG: arginine repressor [Eubacteriaceae bacterium]|jgi:transcriptional regulator of arginine metabolism|nr:arginine repressor [Eubacteriaceae bacterium]
MKISRQTKIIELIDKFQLETQDDLSEKLKELGFFVTQATISRDIKELRLIKVMGKNGKQYYSTYKDVGTLYDERVVSVFKKAVLTVDVAEFLVVLRTLPAMGQAAALAIDSMEINEVVGTIAGDDTIFVAIREKKDVPLVVEKFRKLMKL